jgi:ribosomal protein L5
MEVVIVTTAKTDEEGRTHSELIGMPFVRNKDKEWQRYRK